MTRATATTTTTATATCDLDAAAAITWDALVVGAGPAGALAARQLATAGARVLLVDKKAFPRGKVCGACLNGQALAVLDAVGLGALVADLGGIALDEFQLRLAGRTTRLPLPAGAALSRARFDAALVGAAQAAGARFLPETQATVAASAAGVRRVHLVPQGRKSSVSATARVVLLASGLGPPGMIAGAEDGPVARSEVAAGSRIGAGCVVDDFPDAYREGSIFMAVGRRGYVGLVRVEDGGLNIAAAFEGDFVRSTGRAGLTAASVLAEAGFPAIAALDHADWHGTVPLTRRTRPIAAEGVFLIGDAAGYVEPFTGEGMGWALTGARAVTPLALRAIALDRWDPSLARSWTAIHRKLVGRRQRLCRVLAILLRHPWPARFALELAARAPGLARPFIHRVNAPSVLSQVLSS
jgi:flavin-dependent dehydrogenase